MMHVTATATHYLYLLCPQNPNLKILRGDVLRTNVDQIIRDMIDQHRCSADRSITDAVSGPQLNEEVDTVCSSTSSIAEQSSDMALNSAELASQFSRDKSRTGGVPLVSSDDSLASLGPGIRSEGAEGSGARTPILNSQQDKVRVVANLPYNITKEFLKLMLPKGNLVSELNIMIQVGVPILWGEQVCFASS
jgi:hypothetical protein